METWNRRWDKRSATVAKRRTTNRLRSVDDITLIVYEYIRSMGKDCLRVENTYLFCTPTAPHRWTAIGMGAIRYQTAIGALSNDSVPRLT